MKNVFFKWLWTLLPNYHLKKRKWKPSWESTAHCDLLHERFLNVLIHTNYCFFYHLDPKELDIEFKTNAKKVNWDWFMYDKWSFDKIFDYNGHFTATAKTNFIIKDDQFKSFLSFSSIQIWWLSQGILMKNNVKQG